MTIDDGAVVRDVDQYIRELRRIDPHGTDRQYAALRKHLISLVSNMRRAQQRTSERAGMARLRRSPSTV